MALFGGDMKKRLKCEVVEADDSVPRLKCTLYETDEENNIIRVIGEATILKTEDGLIFENVDIETGGLEEFKKLISATLRKQKPS